jgi:hypothetical protein
MDKATQISNRITNQQLEDLFITAYEGGSSYWCGIENEELDKARDGFKSKETPAPSQFLWAALLAGQTINLYDQEDHSDWTLNLEKLKTGTEKFTMEQVDHYADAVSDRMDAETADAWFQICVLGEIIFG